MRERWGRHQQLSSNIAKLLWREGKEKGGNFREQAQRNALCIVLLFTLFLFVIFVEFHFSWTPI
jgi:hypothetical protein